MKTLLLAIALLAPLVGCTPQQRAQLAADEGTALSYAKKLDTMITSGAALADIRAASSALLAIDPASALLQRVDAKVQSAQTASEFNEAGSLVHGTVVALQTPATSAP